MRCLSRDSIICLFQLKHLLLFLFRLFISASESVYWLTVFSIEVPDFDLREETADYHVVDILSTEIIKPFDAQRVGTQNNLVMDVKIAGLMVIHIDFQVTVLVFGSRCHN